jgi:LPXTG-site transpeptidase (sortase) family protein
MMGVVDVVAPARWTHRALVVAIALALATAGGVVAAQTFPRPVEVLAAPARSVGGPDLEPAVAAATAAIEGLEVALPLPETPPADDRAPTPEVRHGLLEIPAIGLSQPFFEGVTLTAIDRGPSHWPGTAMPGELGNVVIAGHRTTRTRPFWDLDLVPPGAELVFTMDSGERHVYTLDRIEIVDDEAIHIVDQGYGYTATLFGCHPKGSARQRIVGHFTLQHTAPAAAAASAA